MADEPTLANILAGNQQPAAPSPWDSALNALGAGWQNYVRPLGSAHHQQSDWAKQNPQTAQSLAQLLAYLSMLPMGRSMRGAGMGRDAVMANTLENKALSVRDPWPTDPGITGGVATPGSPYLPPRSSAALSRDYNSGALREGLGYGKSAGEYSGVGNVMYLPTRMGQRSANANEPLSARELVARDGDWLTAAENLLKRMQVREPGVE